MNRNKIMKWVRLLHRDLGFFMVGVCFVYAISGLMLNHMNGKDPAFSTEESSISVAPQLTVAELKSELTKKGMPEVKRVMPVDGEHMRVMFNGGIGIYNVESGQMDYEVYKRRPVIYWVNKLHYNKLSGWNVMGDLFAISLIFFAVSGVMMVKGRAGLSGRGKWYVLAGILIPVLYIIFA